MGQIVMVSSHRELRDHLILFFDSGANITVIRDIEWFGRNRVWKKRLKTANNIKGINEADELSIQGTGKLREPFGDIVGHYCPNATANVIADCDAAKYFWIERQQPNSTSSINRYQLTHKINGEIVNFDANEQDLFGRRWWTNDNEYTVYHVGKLQSMGYSRNQIERAWEIDKMHKSMSYVDLDNLTELIRNNCIKDCKYTVEDVKLYKEQVHDGSCLGCAIGKAKEYPAKEADVVPSTYIGELVHCDIFRLTSEIKRVKTILMMVCIDDYSGYGSVRFVKQLDASEYWEAISDIAKEYERKGHVLNKLHVDAEPALIKMCKEYMQSSMNYSVAIPGRHVRKAERFGQWIKQGVRAQIHGLQFKLWHGFYTKLIEYTVGSYNNTYRESNPRLTPNAMFEGKVKSGDAIVINNYFGQLVISKKPKRAEEKNDTARAEIGIIVGRGNYYEGSVEIFDLFSKAIYTRRHVKPIEMTNLYKEILEHIGTNIDQEMEWKTVSNDINDTSVSNEINMDIEEVAQDIESDSDTEMSNSSDSEEEDTSKKVEVNIPNQVNADDLIQLLEDVSSSEKLTDMREAENSWEDESEKNEQNYSDDGDQNANTGNSDDSEYTEEPVSQLNRRSRRVITRNRKYFNALLSNIGKAYKEYGQKATEESTLKELRDNLCNMDVWDYVDREEFDKIIKSGTTILPSSLLFKAKYDSQNVFEKLKARLVACGNFSTISEILGKDTLESPTVNLIIVFIVLALCAKRRMTTKIFDVTGAYLNALLHENEREYMRIGREVAEVMIRDNPDLAKYKLNDGTLIVKLKKAIYGLRLSARRWYELLAKTLMDRGFVRSEWDRCLFIKTIGNKKCYVLVFVDDILVCGDEDDSVNEVHDILKEQFNNITSKVGDTISFLGMTIRKDSNGNIRLSQSGYLENMLTEYDVSETSELPVPTDILRNLGKGERIDVTKFKSLVMKIMFIAIRTRPDVLYATVVLAMRSVDPTTGDYNMAIRILKYLNGTRNAEMIFKSRGEWDPICFVDASFNCYLDAKGHTGFLIFLDAVGSASVYARSIKQKVVADSSTEAELIAIHEAIKNLKWVMCICEELGYKQSKPVTVYQDNKAAIELLSREVVNFKGRSKFINRKYFSVYEDVKEGLIEIKFVGTEEQVADFLTKALSKAPFRKFAIRVMGSDE